MVSAEPTEGRCNAPAGEDNWGYCESWPVTDENGAPRNGRCRMHGGTQGEGKDNPNYKHGAYSEHALSDLSDREQDAYDAMTETLAEGDPEEQRQLIAEAAAEAWLKYKRSGDTKLLREFRMFAEKFNLAPNSDQVNVTGVEEAFMADLRRAAGEDD